MNQSVRAHDDSDDLRACCAAETQPVKEDLVPQCSASPCTRFFRGKAAPVRGPPYKPNRPLQRKSRAPVTARTNKVCYLQTVE
jgi:hypothetical protein